MKIGEIYLPSISKPVKQYLRGGIFNHELALDHIGLLGAVPDPAGRMRRQQANG